MTSHEAETVDVRKKWPHEALDFTPWLACNLDLVGKEIGMELKLVQREKPVGPLYLDILANDTGTGRRVAIENQLEWADLHHLGQLLTYATGCDAHVAIWVAPGFTYEYAQALHRLNEWTRKDFAFYGVMVEVWKSPDDSSLHPRFRKVVYPGGWKKDFTPPGDTMTPPQRKYHDFFRPLIYELTRPDGFADKALYHWNHTGRRFPSRINPGVWYAATLEVDDGAWANLYIAAESKDLTKRIFDELHEDQCQIESEIDAGLEWHWRRHDRFYFSSIYVFKYGCSINDPPEKLDETRAWMLNILLKFKEAFDPRVAEILGNRAP